MTIARAVGALVVLLLAMVGVAGAQPADKPRVLGILSPSGAGTLRGEVFERRLREFGWTDGQNVATFVDQVLRGANPAELPIEQPQKFSVID